MTAARIAERIQFGYGKAAQKLGYPHDLYRPTSPLTPALAPQNKMRAMPFVASQSPDAMFKRPSKYGDSAAYGLFDARGMGPRAVEVGDYFKGPTGTWFVASLEQITISMVVQCNDMVTIVRDGGLTVASEDTYGGRTDATDGALLREWPASVLLGGRTQESKAELPQDVSMKGYEVLLPAWPGLAIKTSDQITTASGLTFVLGGVERTALGLRLDCVLASV